jgi:hypothetical protein
LENAGWHLMAADRGHFICMVVALDILFFIIPWGFLGDDDTEEMIRGNGLVSTQTKGVTCFRLL